MALKTVFKKKWAMVLIILAVCLIGIQFIRPSLDTPPVTGDLIAPPEVKQIIEKACYDCHSNKPNLAWFDQLEPAYWFVNGDIKEARKVLNFSEWDSLSKDQQKAKLFEGLNQIEFKAMPLQQYLLLHPGSKVTGPDIAIIKNYLNTLAPVRISDPARSTAANEQYAKWVSDASGNNAPAVVSAVKPSPNGIAYIPEYKNWKVISTTDRFDNGTLRVITGNETAVRAIQEHHTNPWPNGTRFAKIAWKAAMDPTGVVHAGEFLQVEFMIKDSEKYAATEGWGWGRWRGMQLKPYGDNALFTTECTSCHQPLHDYDFVFTHPIEPLEWKAISSFVNPGAKTMSTIYGNDLAVKSARTGTPYPAGSMITLVSWSQKADEHWFGGRIPHTAQSVEEVSFDDHALPVYTKYEGSPLRKMVEGDPQKATGRIAYIVSQRASVMP